MNTYSTAQVAKLVGIHKQTLLRWLWAGKIPEPEHHQGGGQDVRIWTYGDLRRVREYKFVSYRKGRGRKKEA